MDDPNVTCPEGEACIELFGWLLGISSRDACGDPTHCPSNDPDFCGGPFELCGLHCVCTPDCSQATPANPGDGRGGLCAGVCPMYLKDCCTQDYECADGGACFIVGADGLTTCLPTDCAFQALVPPLCGTSDAHCGPECPVCTPRCEGLQCGTDPNCGMTCGTCGLSAYCLGTQCQPCEFELALQGAVVSPRASTETLPVAQGGFFADGTFDLTDIVLYGEVAEPPAPRREAFRFYGGAGRVEYAVEIPGDTTELPRRVFSLPSGGSLSEIEFFPYCPRDPEVPLTSFTRGFSVTETGLLLIDGNTVFVLTRR